MKEYEKPYMEVQVLEVMDVIRTSDGTIKGSQTNTKENEYTGGWTTP